MAHRVKCYYCSTTFDRDKEPAVLVPGTARRYSHQKCFEISQKQIEETQNDKAMLEDYIKKIFKVDFVPPLAQKQIKQYVTEKNYSYSGILKTLKYHYEIKNGDVSKAHNGIGIVPYCYDAAYRYWFSIWKAQQENKRILEIENSILVPKKVEIHIVSPKRTVMGRKRMPFSFLDEELEKRDDV